MHTFSLITIKIHKIKNFIVKEIIFSFNFYTTKMLPKVTMILFNWWNTIKNKRIFWINFTYIFKKRNGKSPIFRCCFSKTWTSKISRRSLTAIGKAMCRMKGWTLLMNFKRGSQSTLTGDRARNPEVSLLGEITNASH